MKVSGQLHALITLPLRVGCVGLTIHLDKCSIEEKHGIQNYNWKIRRKTWETELHKSVMDGFFWLMIGPSDRLL
jgi:hypothetical protein